jgi:hypothetical protein
MNNEPLDSKNTRMTRLSYGICCWCEQGHFLERLQNKMDWYQRVENLFHEILGGQVGPPPPIQNSGAILVADLISKHQTSAPVEPILVKWDCTSCSNFCKSFAYVWNAGSVIHLLLVRLGMSIRILDSTFIGKVQFSQTNRPYYLKICCMQQLSWYLSFAIIAD